ncbi:MAG: ribosome silencing factor [Prevotella sp.]|nr:ribosome silencing factor [Prevotella sp.]
MNTAKEIVKKIVEGIQEKKGQRIVVADLSQIEGTIAHYFVICQGNSPTQVEAIAESVGDIVREQLHEKPAHVVGLERAQWVAIDYTDVIVHIFVPELREFYDLENLWQDAEIEEISET